VRITAASPHLLVLLSPISHDDEFVINGLANPTAQVPTGIRLTITVANMDPTDSHNWALTDRGPPYSSMPMMGGSMGFGTWMWGTSMMPRAVGGSFWAQTVTFTLNTPGQYWYLCAYPGHAAEGMYGSFVVG
jgi:rusticyanin